MRRALVLPASLLALAALLTSCSSDGGSDPASTTAAPATTTTQADYADLEAAGLTFHAVEEIVSCDGGGIPGDTGSTTAVTADTVPAVDGDLCYVLGPEGGSGEDLRDATVYADGVGIEVAVRDDSVDALNALFDACFEAASSCPAASKDGNGYAAVVVDGRVISTPAVTEAGLASTPFVITGDFDKAQATDIAAAINGI